LVIQGAKKMNQTYFINKLGSRTIFIVISFIIVTLIIDTSITKLARFSTEQSSNLAITNFTILVAIYAIGQYIILEFVKRKINEIMASKHLHLEVIHKVVSITQYAMIVILVSIILQMTITAGYNIFLIEAAFWINYVLSILLLGLLAQRFFSWFKSSRNSIVLAYALAMSLLSINAGFTLLYVTSELTYWGMYMYISSHHRLEDFSSAYTIFNSGYIVTSFLSFILTWAATVLLLHHYSIKLGRIKYWIVVSIPLVYFLSQFQPLILNLFATFRLSEPLLFGIVYTLIISGSKPAGGVLFGIAFWSIARSVKRSAVRDYMFISAYGIMLLFTSNQAAVLITAPYPPFGLVTISFMGLSSYLILVGVYSSAISVAQDVNLRKSIRKTVEQHSNLLDNIGTSQMEQEIHRRVIKITKEKLNEMTEETGVQSSVTEDEMKQYMDNVLKEIKKA
jgi:hypothetical protein